jgi:serine/threonine protein kinase
MFTPQRAKWNGADVAIKVVRMDASDQGNKRHLAMIKSIKMLLALRSPHIVQTFGGCQMEDSLGIVMEFMGRGTLYDWMRQQAAAETWEDGVMRGAPPRWGCRTGTAAQ